MLTFSPCEPLVPLLRPKIGVDGLPIHPEKKPYYLQLISSLNLPKSVLVCDRCDSAVPAPSKAYFDYYRAS